MDLIKPTKVGTLPLTPNPHPDPNPNPILNQVPPLEEALLAGNMQHMSLGEPPAAAPALPEWSAHTG